MKTATAAHRELWKKLATEKKLAKHAGPLFGYAAPCFLVERLTRGAGGVGASRLGGAPDLPATLAWPTRGATHLTFVAQIDLSALTPDWVPDLPRSGWLYFFVGRDEPAWDVAHEVLYFDGPREALSPASAPSGTHALEEGSPNDFVAHQIRFAPSFVVDPAAEEALDLEEFALELLTATATQIGGLPVAWDEDARQDAYLLRSGLAPLLHRLHCEPDELAQEAKEAWAAANDVLAEELERATELLRAYRADERAHEARMKQWRVLFLLASHHEVGMCWWDAGLLQFLVHHDDLDGRRFDRTYCCVSSS
ncbi:hypothetical protein DB32_000269 [Sandaracinus amylolyticus]|uniref:DUF1963 domain-containing protein n=2 Tax=Sandaracinus amylolyticus TaxID=927083 RepID=A0A0F6YG16_9BACT|nr:hypothetical protein DB32_000269 [Sandaracinus amylolyticus]